MQLTRDKRIVLVMAGGSEDGFHLLRTYLGGLAIQGEAWKSAIVTGPELVDSHKHEIRGLTVFVNTSM